MEEERRKYLALQAFHNRAKSIFLILVWRNYSFAAADIRIER
jgi:hypothetical protein